jgi:outer membrane receptor protein involved in Fe transport
MISRASASRSPRGPRGGPVSFAHPAFPYVRTGAYTLLDVDATYTLPRGLELSVGLKNVLDDYNELAWGIRSKGRTFYAKSQVRF